MKLGPEHGVLHVIDSSKQRLGVLRPVKMDERRNASLRT